ncbi:MAG TPA: hypothetical protein VFM70_06330 [Salinimicrobium sp.]|nr:hypothetical protein [Salinimicrobium sp.]
MKNISSFSVFGIILFLIVVTGFSSCEMDDFEGDLPIENNSNIKITTKSYEDLKFDSKFILPFTEIANKIKTSSYTGRGSYMEETYNFTIDSTIIKEIKTDKYVSYTMLIRRDRIPENYFENLVIEVTDTSDTKAYIYQYFPNSPIQKKSHGSFIFDFNFNVIPIQYDENGKASITVGCRLAVDYCNWPNGTDDDAHIAGEGCTKAYIYQEYYELACNDGGGSSPGNYNYSPTGYYSGYNSSDPTPGGGYWGNSTHTQPITCYGLNCPEKFYISNPCDELQEISNDTDYVSELNDLENATANETLVIASDSTDLEGNIVFTFENIPGGEDQVEATINASIHSTAHNHTDADDQLSVFSLSDLYALYVLAGSGFIDDSYAHILVTNQGSGTQYALKFDDMEAFETWGDTFFMGWDLDLGPDTKNPIKESRENIYELDVNPENSNSKNESGLLKFIEAQGLGLELYETNEDFSQWSKIILNNDETTSPDPCQ